MKIKIPFTSRYLEIRSSLANPSTWLYEALSGEKSTAGVNVNKQTALQNTAVFACVRILAETIASLPLPVYRRLAGGGKERAVGHYLYSVFHDQPNPEMTSFELRETLMGHLCLWGNAYCEIVRDGAGRARELWPLRPDRMAVRRGSNNELLYQYTLPDGSQLVLAQSNIFHLRGLGGDGIVGYSPIRMAREAIGLALATEEFGARFFGDGTHPSGVMEHPGKLSEQAHQNLKKSMIDAYSGLGKSHRLMILEEGMKFTQIGIPPEDAQFILTRKFQIAEIARIYRVPLHLLDETDKAATYASVEQFALQFVVHTIRPWLVRWEQCFKRDLFLPGEREIYFAEFLVDGLLRGDIQSRYQAYSTARQWGWMSANDVRERENMNPIEGGDIYMVPLNMVPADMVTSMPQSPAEGAGQRMEKRNIPARAKRPEQYYQVFRASAERLVKWEISELRILVRKHLSRSIRDISTFNTEIDVWYGKDATRDRIRNYMLPAAASYAAVIAADAEEEVSGELASGWADVQANGYTEIYIRDHIDSSKGQLLALSGEPEPETMINTRLNEWEEKRADKIAKWETVNAAGVFARLAFAALGVRYLRWRTSINPCPYCQSMGGKVVGISNVFSLGNMEAEGQEPMRLFRTPKNPPLHEGCVCHIEPA